MTDEPLSPEEEQIITESFQLREAYTEEGGLAKDLAWLKSVPREIFESNESLNQELNPKAHELIVKFETGGKAYYNKFLRRPHWPGHFSGITIGFGYDLGHNKDADFHSLWGSLLSDLEIDTLSRGIGLLAPGDRSRIDRFLPDMQHIEIPWEMGDLIFRKDSIPRYRSLLHNKVERSAEIPPKCEGALLSLVFNRGASFDRSEDRFREMREVKRLVNDDQLDGVGDQIRSMRRLWPNSPAPHGLQGRREREADLFEEGVAERPVTVPGAAVTSSAPAAGSIPLPIPGTTPPPPPPPAEEVPPTAPPVPTLPTAPSSLAATPVPPPPPAGDWSSLSSAAEPESTSTTDDSSAPPPSAEPVSTSALTTEDSSAPDPAAESESTPTSTTVDSSTATPTTEPDSPSTQEDSPPSSPETEAETTAPSSANDLSLPVPIGEPESASTSSAIDSSIPAPSAVPLSTSISDDSSDSPLAPAAAKVFPTVTPPADYPEDPSPPDPVVDVSDPSSESAFTGDEESTEPSEEEMAMDRFLDGTGGVFPGESSTAAYWPKNDTNSPEYAHLDGIEAAKVFELTPADLDAVFEANHFDPCGESDIVILGIRGSTLSAGGFEAERRESIGLTELRPDHIHFKCLLGFYYRSEGLITLFAGSTVPCPYYMRNYYLRMNGKNYSSKVGCNLMPSGCYVSRVGWHRSISPAIRTTDPAALNEDATVTVLRSTNDVAFGTQDTWDRAMPYDNIHCSYYLNLSSKKGAYFSSAGCSTVRGRSDPSDQWAKFQKVLRDVGSGKRLDYVLLTGKEYAIAAQNRLNDEADKTLSDLQRLRIGSVGEEVTKLQKNLGFEGSGYFGPSTKKALAEYQRNHEELRPDGIYSPALDQQLGWEIFTQ